MTGKKTKLVQIEWTFVVYTKRSLFIVCSKAKCRYFNTNMNLSSKFHSLVFLFLFFTSCCLCAKEKPTWGAEFYEYYLILEMGEQKELKLDLKNLNKSKLIESSAEIRLVSDSFELWVDQKIPLSAIENDQWHGSIVMEAVFLGAAQCFVEIEWKTQNESMVERSINYVSVQIIRQKPPVWMYTKYYDTYEIVLYLVTRLLLGTALNWREVVLILEKPLCVTVSICSSILIMPMVSASFTKLVYLYNQMEMNRFFLLFQKDGLHSWFHHLSGRYSYAIRFIDYWRMFNKRNIEFLDRLSKWQYRTIGYHEHSECTTD